MGAAGGIIDNTLGTNIFGENSNETGLQAQTRGTQEAISTLRPWEIQGRNALNSLANNDFMQNWQQDPSYQFQLQEGMKGVNNAMAARGLGNSGAALKDMARFTTGLANQSYQQNYQNNLNRLGMVSGYGSAAAGSIADAHTGLGDAGAAAAMGRANQTGNLVNNLFSLAGAKGKEGLGAVFSDERLKKNLVPVSKEDLDELRKDLKAFYYDYKDQIHGGDRWIGIMAQDLEKTKFGKAIVSENAKGEKMIDMHRVLSVFLATLAEAA